MSQDAGADRISESEYGYKKRSLRRAPRQVIHQPGMALLSIRIVDAQGTQAPTPAMSTVVRPVGAGTPAKPHQARG